MSTTQPTTTIGKAANFAETRVGASALVREFGRKIFPSHWSFMLGEVALYSFIIVVLSGTFLTFFFQPAMGEMHYEGPWLPLRGVEISEAYNSTLAISLEIRGGLFIRQMHHWGALLFVAALSVHMLRVFFTGAFRRPRELNWVVGVLLVIMGMAAGFTGYSLPDDLLSGNGLRIIDGILKSLPLVGTYISFFLFGGEFPGIDIVARLYTLHIMIVPALLIALIGIHLMFVVVHKHTQYPGAGNTEKNVVGEPVLPTFAAKGGGFFFLIFGLLSLISALFTINPIWNYGPYDPSPVSAGTQPDWYIGWADGFLRIVPGWFEFYIFGWPISFNINSAVIVMGGLFAVMFIYPFFEAWLMKDHREHHILDRPRNNPTRTAIGVAGIIFYCNMWAAASGDIVAVFFQMSLNDMIYIFRFLFFFGPIIGYIITKRMCIALQRKDREIALHGRETAHIIRLPHGEFLERHEALPPHKLWKITAFESPEYIPAQPNAEGKVTGMEKLRARLSRFFFEDRVAPVTKQELEASHHSHDSVEGSSNNQLGH
ncbi:MULTISPECIES: cytochrome b [unclassified Brevibacterium]|uniref:cytochrome bc1 complex cytochrome b subunit n=1 Tax=unclassified Brevibacterium TaxID=2614124 RepID=UPI00108181BD|nr:cytochrome bc complex cytochrome b subunit [Brevibacterium sp. S111]TGD10052.1 ubiquinol-cytochrome c reductase cytochrome b subunit [Brevibacterium sp. S111]